MAVTGTIIRGFCAVAVAAVCTVGGIGPAVAEPGPGGHMFGAFAVSGRQSDGSFIIGAAWNFPSQAAADSRAMGLCGGTCRIALRFMDGCGSIAWRGDRYAGGVGRTRDEAERNAINAVGPPFPASISADVVAPVRISGTRCNGQL